MKANKIIIILFSILCFKQVKSQTDTLVPYPNPFVDTLRIKLQLVNTDTVSIKIYNTLGQMEAIVINDSIMSAGNYIFTRNYNLMPVGVYYVTMQTGSITLAKKVLKIDGPAAIETIDAKNDFYIYPNPTSSILNVDFRIQNEKTEVQVIDVLGNEVIPKSKIVNQKCTLDVSSLPAGVYFIRASTSTQKFIKE